MQALTASSYLLEFIYITQKYAGVHPNIYGRTPETSTRINPIDKIFSVKNSAFIIRN